MRMTLKEKIDTILTLSEIISKERSESNLSGENLTPDKTYKAVNDIVTNGVTLVEKNEVLELDFESQNSKIIIFVKNGRSYPINKSNIYFESPVTTTSVDTLIERYRKAVDFVNRVESDVVLNQLVNNDQIKAVAETLVNIPNYDSNSLKLIIAGLKAEILVSESDR